MLVVDDRRDHHVADVGVERRRLAQDVDAAQVGRVDGDLAQQVVGRQAEGVVGVDDDRVAAGQGLGVDGAEPRVQAGGVELGQRDDLGGDAQRRLGADVLDAGGHLVLVALAPQLGAARVEEVTRHEVQEVLPRALRAPLAKARQLLLEVLVLAALDEGDELVLARARQARHQVRERVRVGGDEVQRRVAQLALVEVAAHRRPPAPRHALVADLGPAEHAQAHRLALVGDRLHPPLELLAPGVGQPRPVVGPAAERRGARLGLGALGRRPAGGEHAPAELVPLDLVGDERRHEVVHVGLGGQQHGEHLVAAVVPAPAPRRRLDGLPLLERAEPARRKSAASWPMTTILMRIIESGRRRTA